MSNLLLAALLSGSAVGSRAGTATFDFTKDPTTDPSIVLTGNNATPWQSAGGNPGGFLALLYSQNSQAGIVVFPDIDKGATVKAFTFECDLRIGNAQGNGGRPADGFSISFARASDSVLANLPTSADSSNMAAPGQPENGTKTGIAISFDTWQGNVLPDDPTGDIEGIIVRVDNKTVLKNAMPTRNGKCDDPTSMQTGPYDQKYWDAGGDPLDPGAWAGLCWAHLKTELDDQGKLTVTYKNKVLLDHYQTTYFPSVGRLVLAGRTGGANENTHFDNITISTTPANLATISSLTTGADGFTVTFDDLGASVVDQNSISVSLDGTKVTPTSLSKSGVTTTFKYTTPTVLASGSSHSIDITFKESSGVTVTANRTFTAPLYALLPAASATQADTSKPGFLVRTWQSPGEPNSIAWAEEQLAGLHGDNEADTSTFTDKQFGNSYFDEIGTINYWDSGGEGNFTNNGTQNMPGVAGADNYALEILTYLELPAGITTMGVNSDDGFRVYGAVSPNPIDAFAPVLGQFDGGRGVADTTFTIYAATAGFYPFRMVYEEGGGDSAVEWFTVKPDGTKVLVNDAAKGGLKAYRVKVGGVDPTIKSVSPAPAPRQVNKVSSSVSIVLVDGDTKKIDDKSIVFKVDGAAVTTTNTRNGGNVTVTYAPTGLQVPTDKHTAELSFKDTSGSFTRNQTWKFQNLKNLVLPAAKITENFDSYPEDTQPTGWVATNFTSHCDDGRDVTVQSSESYENWVIVSTDNMILADAGSANVAPGQTFNGKPVDTIASGKVLYAESDGRCNSDALSRGYNGQAQFIVSKAFDCSQITNVVLTLSALYTQNQDSLGAIEYSVDGGKTFLPVVYYLDSPDIALNADGTVDGVKTFTNANTDTADWVVNGTPKGNNYGDGIAAPITAALGDYVAPRINDDQTEGARIEVFRLPEAGKKSDVRLRFAQLGTDSWWFAVDNIAFYDVAPPATVPTTGAKFNTPTLASGKVVLSWTGSGTLEQADSIAGPWAAAPTQTNPQTISTSGAVKFYRIRQ